MKLEVSVLNGKLIVNSPNIELTQQLLSKLRELGIEVEVKVPDVRCG